MREITFRNLKQMKDDNEFYKLNQSDFFLYGTKIIEQINTKKVGDQITYYVVLQKKGKNIEYQMVFDVLEDNKKEEENNG